MQNFIDQAIKNGVTLLDTGNCQFCGADYQRGIFDCMEHYNRGLDLLDLNNPKFHISRFLSVDAHALQHPEIHGRWNNHFHLTRLNLILDKGQIWNYQKSPLLSQFLNNYKLDKPDEFLSPPKVLERGKITAKDLTEVQSAEECVELIQKWANEVYQAWSPNHELVSKIAEGFSSRA